MKKIIPILMCVLCLSAMLPQAASAEDEAASVSAPQTEIAVDQTDGTFSFDIVLQSDAPYAGAEFGVICSESTQITAVSVGDGTVTGPQKANGLTWFGYFDGEDSFSGETTITVQGTCEIGVEGAVVIQDVSVYAVGQQEYATTDVACDVMVNLRTEPIRHKLLEIPEIGMEEIDISVLLLIAGLLVIAAVSAGALIYRKKKYSRNDKENQNAYE